MHVLLIDDHFCAREGAACLLRELFTDLQVWQADSVAQGLAIARNTPLNLLLLDVQLPGQADGLAGLEQFRSEFPDLCVVMYSALADRELVFETLRRGATGFICKTLPRPDFIQALQDVLSGKVYLPTTVLEQAAPLNAQLAGHSPTFGLTSREFEVLAAVVQGKSNKAIARQLGIEEQTVKNHLRPVFQKLGVVRRSELLVKVFQQGMVFGKPAVGNY